jgi:hypothetical protein
LSLRSADVRFLIPDAPRTAFVGPGLDAWRNGLAQAGVAITASNPDIAVVGGREHVPAGAKAVIVVGRGGRRLRTGFGVRRFVTVPGPVEPHLIVPVDRKRVGRYAVDAWTAPSSLRRRVRNRTARAAIASGFFPDLARSLTVAAPTRPPFPVAAAQRFGVPPHADWFLTLGEGDALTRAVFHIFPAGATEPAWVLKLARVPGYLEPFDSDEQGLRLAAHAGGSVAAHAPRFVARFDAETLPCSLETAAVGRRLTYLLQGRAPRSEKLVAIERLAAWTLALAKETAAPPEALAAERARLEHSVLAESPEALRNLVARLPEVPAVLQHDDLGCWNVIVGRGGFTVVDWESARPHGLPLWDLVYFLIDALVLLDDAWTPDRRQAHAARLLRGETPSSAILFHWLRRAADALEVPAQAVGPIVTLGWLQHRATASARAAAARSLAPGVEAEETFSDWMSHVWLTTPGLGPEWSSWRQD